jgi:hypothetical protein
MHVMSKDTGFSNHATVHLRRRVPRPQAGVLGSQLAPQQQQVFPTGHSSGLGQPLGRDSSQLHRLRSFPQRPVGFTQTIQLNAVSV